MTTFYIIPVGMNRGNTNACYIGKKPQWLRECTWPPKDNKPPKKLFLKTSNRFRNCKHKEMK